MCTPSSPCPAQQASTPTKPAAKRRRAAAQKIDELTSLENRLLAASQRSQQAGHARRANSYVRQARAVRQERESWTLVANNPSPPAAIPHMLAAVLCVILPLVDLFVAGGNAAKRLSRVVFTIGVVVCGVVLGTSTSNSWFGVESHPHTPVHWVKEIATRELSRKDSHGSITRLQCS